MPEIISRDDARARGLKRFFTGGPCPHGHIAERYVSTNRCVTCNTLDQKRRRVEHPERTRASNRRWKAKPGNYERWLAATRRWQAENKEHAREYTRERAKKLKAGEIKPKRKRAAPKRKPSPAPTPLPEGW